jgi:hypothetical protein
MAKRRSMAEAFDDQKLAFIHGNAARESGRGPEKQDAPDEPASAVDTSDPEPAVPRAPAARRGRKPKSADLPFQTAQAYPDFSSFEGYGPLLVSLTTRLSPATAEALRRASLELRLQRRRPHTQQEIVEAAVQTWLKSHGFVQAA